MLNTTNKSTTRKKLVSMRSSLLSYSTSLDNKNKDNKCKNTEGNYPISNYFIIINNKNQSPIKKLSPSLLSKSNFQKKKN